MALILKGAGIAFIALIALLRLRETSGRFSVLIKIGTVVLLFALIIGELAVVFGELLGDIRDVISQDEFLNSSVSVMLKALGVALIGKICADVCKECGENGIAEGVEMLSGVVILSLSLPMLSKILGFASEMLKRSA
jgi:stage III sporulation protein AD